MNMTLNKLLLMTGIVMSTTAMAQLKYPITARDADVADVYFGTKVAEPYRWLENDTSAATAK